jgi:hypothetical protein
MEKWKLKCLESHSLCQSGGFTPRRLLHIGVNHIDIAKDPIRLIEARSNLSEPFVALSHCWGKIQHVTTTRANYHQRLASIPMQELSKTFQDAVWLTRRLEIKYLWIDSLCILQDDVDDWKREASTMSRLYAAAYLTIAASHGVDGSAGILYEGGVQPRVLDIEHQAPNGQTAVATMVLTPRVHYSESNQAHQLYGNEEEIINPSFTDGGLLSRAWAFQERALSTRIVHFTKDELVWECKEKRWCECGDINGASFITSLVGSIQRRYKDSDSEEDDNDENSVSRSTKADQQEAPEKVAGPGINNFDSNYSTGFSTIWWTFVEYYTTRNLTKPEDRGAAFVGIAKIFGEIMRESDEEVGEYCAGMWQNHLPESLLWTCSTGENKRVSNDATTLRYRIKGAVEPSWSWYSVNGPCWLVMSPDRREPIRDMPFGLKHRKRDGLIGDLSHEPKCAEQYGFIPQLVSFILLIEELKEKIESSYEPRRGALNLGYGLVVVATRTSAIDVFTLRALPERPLSGDHSIDLLADDPEDQHFVGDITCLDLAGGCHPIDVTVQEEESSDSNIDYIALENEEDERLGSWGYDFHDCNEHIVGLALVPVPGEQKTFRRIGLFHAKGAACVGTPYSEDSGRRISSSKLPSPSLFFHDWYHSLDIRSGITLI